MGIVTPAVTKLLPLVSVIMPVRSGERWLAIAVDSLLAQTLQDFEILIIDDGSTDTTPAILRDYAGRDRRIRVIRQDALGLVAALNRGLEEARASLVARLDADDAAMPERLQRQLAHMQANAQIGLLGSWAQKIDASGQPIGWLKPATDPQSIGGLLLRANPMIHSTVMMRRDLVRKLGGYREAFRGAEDYDLWLRMSEAAAIANLSECLIQYRWHSDNVSNRQRVRQAFSARLARRSMRLRRSSAADPAEALAAPPDWWSIAAETSFYADDASLYRALDLADTSSPWNPRLNATDLKPILCSDPQLSHDERKLAALAIGRHMRNAPWSYSRGTVHVLLRLARAQPKIALKALWRAISMRASQAV
jgi:glycosyltransferase involved in cell wall biosynthesis